LSYLRKKLADLTLSDFDLAWVWRSDWANDDEETVMPIPGKDVIAKGDALLWVRINGELADGTTIAGVALINSDPLELSIPSFFIEGRWMGFNLPPAPEFVLKERGPETFAHGLGRELRQVFPITIRTEIKAASTGRIIESVISYVR